MSKYNKLSKKASFTVDDYNQNFSQIRHVRKGLPRPKRRKNSRSSICKPPTEIVQERYSGHLK